MNIFRLPDSYKNFVYACMHSVNSEDYTKEDIEAYYLQEHITLGALGRDGKSIVAFVGLIRYDDGYRIVYTWCDNTHYGKRQFVEGIKFIFKSYLLYIDEDVIDKHNIVSKILKRK